MVLVTSIIQRSYTSKVDNVVAWSLSCTILTRTRSRFDTFNTRRPVRRKSQVCVLIRHFSPLFRISFHRCATVRFADVLHFVPRLLELTDRSIRSIEEKIELCSSITKFLNSHYLRKKRLE